MKKSGFVLAVAALLLAVSAARAANVCVWNYDTLDRFFDSEVGDSIDCGYWVERTLVTQGHIVDLYQRYLPASISEYDIVFCLMGWYRC